MDKEPTTDGLEIARKLGLLHNHPLAVAVLEIVHAIKYPEGGAAYKLHLKVAQVCLDFEIGRKAEGCTLAVSPDHKPPEFPSFKGAEVKPSGNGPVRAGAEGPVPPGEMPGPAKRPLHAGYFDSEAEAARAAVELEKKHPGCRFRANLKAHGWVADLVSHPAGYRPADEPR